MIFTLVFNFYIALISPICVLNVIVIETGFICYIVLLLLDLSAAFDTADHNVLLTRLEESLIITGLALDWFKSYLLERTQHVVLNGFHPTLLHSLGVSLGVPCWASSFSVFTFSNSSPF